jgi:uncharacterized protein YdhG (YjbR/CyaY superfamily)
MKKIAQTTGNVDDYIAGFPDEIRTALQELREVIKRAAPNAEEIISYRMPAYRQKEVLVYFAAFKDHVSLFPTSSGVAAFSQELSGYRCSKGTIQFPLNCPLPLDLISRIVRFRLGEALAR